MLNNTNKQQNVKNKNKLQRGSTIFYVALMAFPVIQFILFYIVVNFRSFGYAFMEITHDTALNQTIKEFSFKQFAHWFTDVADKVAFWESSKMSLLYYGVSLFVGIPLGLLFSYYIFKKMPASTFFRIFLFLPSIIPAAALALTYKIVLNEATLHIFGHTHFTFNEHPLLFIIFYNVYVSFGTSVLMYANKMFDISPEVVEAATLDGATGIKEFWYVVLPLTFPTISVFLITGIATIFTNQYNLYLLTETPDYFSLGHLLYLRAGKANEAEMNIPPVAALGLILTAIAVPLTFLVKYCLEKFGPKEE